MKVLVVVVVFVVLSFIILVGVLYEVYQQVVLDMVMVVLIVDVGCLSLVSLMVFNGVNYWMLVQCQVQVGDDFDVLVQVDGGILVVLFGVLVFGLLCLLGCVLCCQE